MQMEPARIETLLETGWGLVGQLHQWLSTWPRFDHDQDELAELICDLQLFWVKADDLSLKRLARTSLALEQFFERLCAKKLVVTSEHLKDVKAGVASFEDQLLEFEATGDDSAFPNFESLNRLEKQTLKAFWSEAAKRTIDVVTHGKTPIAVITAASEPTPIPRLEFDGIRFLSRPRMTLNPRLVPEFPELSPVGLLEHHEVNIEETDRPSNEFGADESPPDAGSNVSDGDANSNRVLIVEESLFYRHLIEIALTSAGYETETMPETLFESTGTADTALRGYRAVVLTATASATLSSRILDRDSRQKVIGLKSTVQEEHFDIVVDACVMKSQPLKLILALKQLLDPTNGEPRKIA